MSSALVADVPPPPELARELLTRIQIDRSCRQTVLAYYISAVAWLVIGSVLALVASIKMHEPTFLTSQEWMTFGRVRPAHLNAMIYGWGSMAGIGTLLWLEARLCRVRLPFRTLLPATAIVWNVSVIWGVCAILAGYGSSVEWLEMPPQVLGLFGFVLLVLFGSSLAMFLKRRVGHTYVSQWYLFGATVWFPFLYSMAVLLPNTGLVSGAAWATANWWFAHNVLGLWLTPIGLATGYYLIPKVAGKPIHSYHLSLLGFWSLALFYNWVGTHHLIGGPLPAWVITVGIVGSIMMFIPVITVAINHHLTMVGSFYLLRRSPTLRFVVFGAMSYTVVSFEGSLEALRSVNRVSHFTHFTIAHAHLGVYAFFSMTMFGAFYYVMPRLTRNEWASAGLIKIHFWTAALGIVAYVFALTWAGWQQGSLMLNPNIAFLKIVGYTKPYLVARSASGILMTVGHCVFAYLVWRILKTSNVPFNGPTLFGAKLEPRPAK